VAKSKKTAGQARSRGAQRHKARQRSVANVARKGTGSGTEPHSNQPGAGKGTKIASMTVLLCRIKGVSLDELCKHTGWQPHSVRAVISSVIKKKLGLEVVSERIDGVRIYRVVV
jgi:hypothetical protein